MVVAATEEEVSEAIRLKRLSPQGVYEYVEQVMGQNERLEKIAALLHPYSGGLPLLMVEALRYLAPRFYRGESFENLLPPPQISLFYQEKIRSLSPAEEELLHLMALLFRPVKENELSKILEINPEGLAELSKSGLKKGLFTCRIFGEIPIPTYQMTSQALSLDLIGHLEPERRKSLHRKIAHGLMRSEGIPPEEIAYHLSKGGETERAAEFYENAALSLKTQGQIAAAARCFSKAVEILPEGSARRSKLLLEKIRLSILSGDYPEAKSELHKMEDASWECEELKGWLAFKERRFPAARGHYQKALKLLPEENLHQKVLIENALANVDLQDGKTGEAAQRFRKTLEWEALLPKDRQGRIQNHLGIALILLGDSKGALEFYDGIAQKRAGRMTPEEEISLLNGKAFVYLQAGLYQETVTTLKKAMNLAEESGALHSLSSIMGNLISALLKETRYAESLPLLKKIVAFEERLGNFRDVAYNLIRAASVYLTLGMGEAAEDCLGRGREFIGQGTDPNLSTWYYLVEGYWEREHGSFDRALDLFRRTEREAEKIGNREITAWAVYAEADLAYERKEIEECKRLLEKIPPDLSDKEFGVRLRLIRAKMFSGAEGEKSERLFSEVEEECRKGRFREILWEVYYAWGWSHWTHDHREKALDLMQKGRAVVEEIASSLPEEYHDRYLHQRSRKKLLDDEKEFLSSMQKGFGRRILGWFKRHPPLKGSAESHPHHSSTR